MKQNDDKTESFIIGTPGQLKKGNKQVNLVSFLIKKWIPKHKLIIFPRQDTIMWET